MLEALLSATNRQLLQTEQMENDRAAMAAEISALRAAVEANRTVASTKFPAGGWDDATLSVLPSALRDPLLRVQQHAERIQCAFSPSGPSVV